MVTNFEASASDWDSWIREMQRLVQEFVFGFERIHGFSPGEHEVVRVSSSEGAEAVDALSAAGIRGDLLGYYTKLGAVTLPDLESGIWIDDAPSVIEGIAAGNYPTRLEGSLQDSVTVFATDGGGAMFAVSATKGCVYRLSLGALIGSTYEVDDAGWSVAADDLWSFMDQLRNDLAEAVGS
ncbi:hypothetical protein ABT009_26000 [Streptomyces sp. NPDC002896]|uniref:hypothetical protein n=1 Tax=Streptomyces sp. NPDC002896 TaxID=3154438 RepID=UPI0033290A98